MANICIGKNTVNIDLDLGTTQVQVEHTDTSLDDLWQAEYSKYQNPWVCVSGGADSQLTANLAQRYSKNPQAVTFAFVWDHTVVNAPDLVQAQRFCQSIGIPHQILDVDLRDFLENHLSEIALRYECVTPQLASHLWAIQTHLAHTHRPILYGGEAPFVTVMDDKPVMIYDSDQGSFTYGKFFKEMMLPFYLFGKIHDVEVNRDPFTLTPQIHYQSVMHNAQVWHQDQIMIPEETTGPRKTALPFKYAYYQNLGYHFEFPLCKRTGFELLKQHLAQQTGDYDEFDRRYRHPLRDLLSASSVHGKTSFQNTISYQGDIEQLKHQLDMALRQSPELVPGTRYNFDW